MHVSTETHLPLQVFAIYTGAHMKSHTNLMHAVDRKLTKIHTHYLALTPVQEHMSPPTPLRIGVINQTLRCRLCSTNMHTHTHSHSAGSRTQQRHCCQVNLYLEAQ